MRTRTAVVICSCIATAVAIAGAGITVHGLADARWTEMTAWMQQADAEYARRDTARPVAHGTATADAAFPHYRRALALAQPLLQDDDGLVRLWCQDMLNKPAKEGPMSPAEGAAIRVAWAPALDELKVGAHCARTGPAVDLAAPLQDATSLLAARWLVNLSVLEARAAADAGQRRIAVERLLDALTFALDLSRSPLTTDRLIGIGVASTVVLQGCAEERLTELDRPALDLLATGLARLDDGAVARVRSEDDVLVAAHYLLQRPAGDRDDSPGATLRYGLSERWMHAAAVLEAVAAARALDGTPEPWSERQRAVEHWDDQVFGTTNPVRVMFYSGHTEQHVRCAQAQLRMLRLAVDLQRGVPLPCLQDPFAAAPLAVERGPDAVRFVSEGRWSNDARIDRTARLRR